jgi:ABC-type Fe3+/spermidine/putrescine transport system ATPase subunit
MFQDFALFPHKNVFENVAFGLRMAGTDKARIQQRVGEMLGLVDLAGYETRRVYELSGGQQQRVALARSLAPSPTLLMLDEPLGSLDRTLREELMGELRHILKRVSPSSDGLPQPKDSAQHAGMAALYVTHDQQEAFAVADRVIILHAGRIEQEGPPLALYRQPANPFVARFLGMRNLLAGQLVGELAAPEVLVATSLGVLRGCRYLAGPREGDAVTVLLRPDAVTRVSTNDEASEAANVLHGRLGSVSFRGSQVKIELGDGLGGRLVFELPGAMASTLPPIGQPLSLVLDAQGINVLAAEEFAGGDEGAR